jgi:hypothetical protein
VANRRQLNRLRECATSESHDEHQHQCGFHDG